MVTKQVLRVVAEGTVTSFRYPHFAQGFQPTYELPPPSTVYGHICSTVGEYLTAQQLETLEFGYHFTHDGKFVDHKEHLHFSDPIQPFPFDRELLFNPRLTLYLSDLSLEPYFREPHYAVGLGRSQDLMSYTDVDVIELQQAEEAYFEGTLLPDSLATRLETGIVAITMAQWIDQRRRPIWKTYLALTNRVTWPPPSKAEMIDEFDLDEDIKLVFEGDEQDIEIWVDPDSPDYPKRLGVKRAVYFHRFWDV